MGVSLQEQRNLLPEKLLCQDDCDCGGKAAAPEGRAGGYGGDLAGA
jgi:hypothetical protein